MASLAVAAAKITEPPLREDMEGRRWRSAQQDTTILANEVAPDHREKPSLALSQHQICPLKKRSNYALPIAGFPVCNLGFL